VVVIFGEDVMAIPLRVVQYYTLDEQGERVYTGYKLQVTTSYGWADVPVVNVEQGKEPESGIMAKV
jgi:hypothetical protein